MKLIKLYHGFLLGLASLLLFQVAKVLPQVIEAVYTNGIYRLIRWLYSFTLTYIPFPLLYLFILLLVFILVRRFFVKKKMPWLPFLCNFVGWIVFIFYWSWGFNYARSDFHKRVDLELREPEKESLYAELLTVDSILQALRKDLQPIDSLPINAEMLPKDLEGQVMQSQVKVLESLGEPLFAKPKIRRLRPKGSLLRIKTAGVYFPFVFEGHIDDGLHHIEKPYVMAHEMAHAYSFTDEGVCNFIGFMTCINSEHTFLQYSGWMEYQGYLYRALRRNFPETLKEEAYRLPKIVTTDLKSIRERLDKYPSIAPKLRDLFYNNYLKAQGVSDGMKSYSQITRLAYSYKVAKGGYKI